MNIKDVHLTGGTHLVILGAGASIASTIRDPELNGLLLPSMNNLPEICGLNNILEKFPKELICDNFEATYSNIVEHDPKNKNIKIMNDMIYSYFKQLKLPDKPTIYDYLIMSLREKDVIATFNWDPFLYQAWWRNYHHGSKPHMLYLHGNVAVGFNEEYQSLGRAGMYSSINNIYFTPSQLLFPIKQKNYNQDPLISTSWAQLQDVLNKDIFNTHNVTIFGYSAPMTDAEALKIMKQAWGDKNKRYLEQIEFIDIRPKDEIISSWSQLVYADHYDYHTDFFQSSLAQYPRRTDEAFFCHYLPNSLEKAFVESNPVPTNFSTLQELWQWHKDLIIKEKNK